MIKSPSKDGTPQGALPFNTMDTYFKATFFAVLALPKTSNDSVLAKSGDSTFVTPSNPTIAELLLTGPVDPPSAIGFSDTNEVLKLNRKISKCIVLVKRMSKIGFTSCF